MSYYQDQYYQKMVELLAELNAKLETSDLSFTGTDLDVNSNRLRYSDVLFFSATITDDTTVVSAVPSGYVYELTQCFIMPSADAVWQLEKDGTDNRMYIRTVTALTPYHPHGTIWLKVGDTLQLDEKSGTANCHYTISGIKWEIL